MDVHRHSDTSTAPPPEQTFTGRVGIGGCFRRPAPSRLAGAAVTFAPGARTPWKTNPCGQTVVVTGGAGLAQVQGEDVVEVRAGDLLWFPPDVRHWEGAAPDETMTCIAQHEGEVRFHERVSDEQYRSPRLDPTGTSAS